METQSFGKFSEIRYERPDFKASGKAIGAQLARMKKATDYTEFRAAFSECEAILSHVMTMMTIAHIRNTLDMTDPFYDEEQKYINKAGGSFSMIMLKLTDTILKSRFRREIDEEFGPFLLKELEENRKVMSPKIILLSIREGALEQQYSKDAATCKTVFRGEECNFYGLLKHMQSTDRAERREAFIAWADLYESVSPKLDDVYDQLVAIRTKIAKRMKFPSFTEYAYLSRGRYDYTPEDIARFRSAVKQYIVPLCEKLYEKQRMALGVDRLHFYDEELTFPEGNAVPIGDKDELVQKALRMYRDLSPETGEFFSFMNEHELFDLQTRPGKHMGGYCTFIRDYKAPFIFSNFNGTSADVDVLTHEAGHAFQGYLASRSAKTFLQTGSTSEINEIHSMSMEHFAYPYMDLFFGENADRYRYHHLVKAVETIPYLVSVDEFQHRVYEKPAMTAAERRAVWHEIEQTYLPWRDYDGNRFLEEGGFWMQKQHIFLYPFYYVDYALAQTCAFQLFLRSREDFPTAWTDYLNLCKAGGTQGYFDLLKVARLENPFREETVRKVSEQIASVIEEYAAKI